MTDHHDMPPGLARELLDLGRAVDTGAPPHLAPTVRAALADRLDHGRRPAPRRLLDRRVRWGRPVWPVGVRRRAAAAVLAVVVALAGTLVLSPAARAVAVRLLTFAGIQVQDTPPPGPRGSGTLPGERGVELRQAQRAVSFSILAPPGDPARVAVSDGGRVVTLWYAPTADRPALRIDQSGLSVEPFFRKYVDPAQAEYVTVGGASGLWVRAPHDVAYVDEQGRPQRGTVRLSAATLIWRTAGSTVRLEGVPGREDAIRVAGTLAFVDATGG